MSIDASDSMASDPAASPALRKRAERDGFIARSSGSSREANPHVHPTAMPYLDLRTDATRRALADAWWQGWDQADADLT